MQNHILCHSFRSRLLAGAAFAVAGISPGFAQDAVQAADEPTVEKVTVTGSRLRKRDYTTTSPVTTITSQTFELTATTSVEALLNDLPQLVPGNTFTSNNAGGEEFATLDLRGIGPNRTLILVNGNRLPASSTTGVTDINTIPVGLIDRVEVVTGGASAVYGSDAMAGVVNFILKKNFEGMEITGSAGQGEHGFAETRDVQALIGGNFAGGNGNVTIFGEYFSREGLLQSKQEFSRVAGSYCYTYSGYVGRYESVTNIAEARACQDGGYFTGGGGSGTPPWGWIANNSAPVATRNPFANLSGVLPAQFTNVNTDCNPATVPVAAVNSGNISFNDLGAVTPRFTSGACGFPDRGDGLGGNSSRYNYAPDNYIVLPAERYNVSIFGHYDIEKELTVNFGAIYSDSFTRVQLAPTPATGIQVKYTDALKAYLATAHPDLNLALQNRAGADNILGNADDRPDADFVMDRRTTELGTRNGLSENSNLNLFASLEGSFADGWNYEVSASFADVDFISKLENSANKTALQQGAAGCMTKHAGADGLYGTADDVDVPLGPAALPSCTQVDLFGPGTIQNDAGPDGIAGTPDDQFMVNFLKVNTWSRTSIEETILSGFVSGDLFDVTGAGPIAAVAGVEYRSSDASFEVDNEQRTGNIFGFNALQDQAGAIDVYEGYTEASIPLVKDQPYVYFLGVEAGYRISDYTNVGVVQTYKYGGEYSPFEWLKFRGIYNKATRAPSVFEGFQSGDQGFANFIEPCRDPDGDGAPSGATQTDCVANGVPLGVYVPAPGAPGFVANNSQVQALSFGNTNLSPETAETTTFGLVLQTGNDWFGIGNLRASVDKYDIDIAHYITTLGTDFYLNDCFTNGVTASCDRIVRNPLTGQIDHINTTRSNDGSLVTSGIDFQLDYRLDLEDIGLTGVLTINELYSVLDSFVFDSDAGDGIPGDDVSGGVSSGIGGAFPEWKSVLSGTYTLDDWTLFSRWSYNPSMVSLNFGPHFDGSPHTSPEASYVDIAARYNATDWMSVTISVSNVADEGAPITLDGIFYGQGNTDPQVYDVIGRSWNLAIKTKL